MRVLLILFLVIIFYGCDFNSTDKIKTPKPINYTVKQKTYFFNQKYISFELDSDDFQLYIKLSVKGFKNFPFPINKKYNDTLHKTAFAFNFYTKNKPIISDYKKLKNTFRFINDTSQGVMNLSAVSDTIDLLHENTVEIKLPIYAFHNLKNGKQIIVLKISQTNFTDELYLKDSMRSSNYVHLYSPLKLLNAEVSFELEIPPIYKSVIYGQGLTLQNDTLWSPAGMDNTIWKSSYPDIYWTIIYPKNEYYVQTNFETSTSKYVSHDTFDVYHYFQNDSIGFGVFDHDNLSRDDWMGDWWGSLSELYKSEYKRLKFNHVKIFDLKVKKCGKVN